MKFFQLIFIVLSCCTYGSHQHQSHGSTSIHIGHRPELIEDKYSAIGKFGQFGQFDKYLGPIKSCLQKATVAICHNSKLCSHEILNEPPFVNLLGPYQFHESHLSPLSFLSDLSPSDLFSQVLQDIIGGVKSAEADVITAPFKAAFGRFKGILG